MKCPNCVHNIEVTWSRYLTSPLGGYTCPVCGQKSRLKFKWIEPPIFAIEFSIVFMVEYAVISNIYGSMSIIDAVGDLISHLGLIYAFLAMFVPAMMVLTPINRFMDSKYGELQAVQIKK